MSKLALRAGLFNAALATVFSAVALAWFNGAGRVAQEPNVIEAPMDLVKAVAVLIPFTAVWCGTFALLAGAVGAYILRWRGWPANSLPRYLVKAALLGLSFGIVFVFYDLFLNRTVYYRAGWVVLAPPFGMVCVLLTAWVFRRPLRPEET